MARGSAIVEFALAWPVALLLVLGCVEVSVWELESYTARSAALAGAHAAAAGNVDPNTAATITARALAPAVAGAHPVIWCPGAGRMPPDLWVCVIEHRTSVEVVVGGSVPALVPLFGGRGLPLHADVLLDRERFAG